MPITPSVVRIDQVTTKAGDDGHSALVGGTRLPKEHPIFEALGAIDEANAWLGNVLAQHPQAACAAQLAALQHRLFDVGADLATPLGSAFEAKLARITAADVAAAEAAIAAGLEGLAPLTSFVLPGGSTLAAGLHVARAMLRRAERAAWAAHRLRGCNVQALIWLNRLSDLLFVLARRANDLGKGDVLWKPTGAPA